MGDLQKITEEQMNAVGVCSAPDVLSGSTSENKAVFDKMVRQLVAPAYNAAVDTINAINETETGVEAAEAKRAAAEAGRVETEAGRADAEAARVRAEQERQEAEQTRSDGESARQEAENARKAAEQARAEAEQSRMDAEAARRQAEQQRVDSTNGIVAQATGQAHTARDSAVRARSWAVGETGTREGENTDNARYWAQQAHAAAGGGVVSFNGRTGSVIPKKGDYTASDVGASPEGYGLGYNYGGSVPGGDINNATKNGWYSLAGTELNAPTVDDGVQSVTGAMLFVQSSRSDRSKVQWMTIGNAGFFGYTLRRYYNPTSTEWSSWEWLNPPMQLGVEYRTTERFNGKPVYAKLVDCGAPTVNGVKTVTFDSTGTIDKIVDCRGESYGSLNSWFLPSLLYGASYNIDDSVYQLTARATSGNGNIYIYSNNSYSSGNDIYALVKYTKLTD